MCFVNDSMIQLCKKLGFHSKQREAENKLSVNFREDSMKQLHTKLGFHSKQRKKKKTSCLLVSEMII